MLYYLQLLAAIGALVEVVSIRVKKGVALSFVLIPVEILSILVRKMSYNRKLLLPSEALVEVLSIWV